MDSSLIELGIFGVTNIVVIAVGYGKISARLKVKEESYQELKQAIASDKIWMEKERSTIYEHIGKTVSEINTHINDMDRVLGRMIERDHAEKKFVSNDVFEAKLEGIQSTLISLQKTDDHIFETVKDTNKKIESRFKETNESLKEISSMIQKTIINRLSDNR
jgi:hypothetical protein